MSRALLIRSIPLSTATRTAWKEADTHFAKRGRTMEEVQEVAYNRPIINLGNSGMDAEGIWNRASVVAPLLTPEQTRALMPTLLPSNRWSGVGYYWLKTPGRGGEGKAMKLVSSQSEYDSMVETAVWNQGDIQVHVNGSEYRVITVQGKVVQVTQRIDEGDAVEGHRRYAWTGVRNAPSAVKEVARTASSMLSDNKTVIGWDVILDRVSGDTYILEGNTCPGVNAATAVRILDAVTGVSYDE